MQPEEEETLLLQDMDQVELEQLGDGRRADVPSSPVWPPDSQPSCPAPTPPASLGDSVRQRSSTSCAAAKPVLSLGPLLAQDMTDAPLGQRRQG